MLGGVGRRGVWGAEGGSHFDLPRAQRQNHNSERTHCQQLLWLQTLTCQGIIYAVCVSVYICVCVNIVFCIIYVYMCVCLYVCRC